RGGSVRRAARAPRGHGPPAPPGLAPPGRGRGLDRGGRGAAAARLRPGRRVRQAHAAQGRGQRGHRSGAAAAPGRGAGLLRRAVAGRDRVAAERAARHREVVDGAGAAEAARARASGGAAMSRHRDEHLDLCAASVLGALAEAERRELEAHLAEGCEPCEAELRALAGGATVLALSVPQHRAPAGVRARVLAKIESGGPREAVVPLPRPPRAAEPWRMLLAAAALTVAAGVGVVQWRRAEQL